MFSINTASDAAHSLHSLNSKYFGNSDFNSLVKATDDSFSKPIELSTTSDASEVLTLAAQIKHEAKNNLDSHNHDSVPLKHLQPLLKIADFDGNGVVTRQDVRSVAKRVGGDKDVYDGLYHPLFDVNADGLINPKDVKVTRQELGKKSSRLDQQVAQLVQATIKYYGPDGLQTAIQDGYLPFTDPLIGHGVHYFNPKEYLKAPEAPLSFDKPFGLNFNVKGQLKGVFYFQPQPWYNLSIDPANLESSVLGFLTQKYQFINSSTPPKLFASKDEFWHCHDNVWFSNIGNRDFNQVKLEQDLTDPELVLRVRNALSDANQTLFPIEYPFLNSTPDPHNLDPAASPYPPVNTIVMPFFYMMHAWVHDLNPDGLFAEKNPKLKAGVPETSQCMHDHGQMHSSDMTNSDMTKM